MTRDGSGFSVLLGLGNGAFAPARENSVRAEELVARDFNRDGKMDLAVASSSYVHILFGDGEGNFDVSTNIPVAVDTPERIDAADLNSDGHLDLSLGSCFLFSQGDGGFDAPYYFQIGQEEFRIADVNSDGSPDLIYALHNGTFRDSFCVATNWGGGQFLDRRYFGTTNSQTHPMLETGDLDGDLKPDVFVLSSETPWLDNSAAVWLNKGDGTFRYANDYRLDFPVKQIAFADFNLDGRTDAIVQGGSVARILYGYGDGSFTIGEPMPITGALAIGDFDRNGTPDIIYADSANTSVSVMLNEVSLAFGIAPTPGCHQITWPNIPGYILEYTTNLAVSGSWVPFPDPPVVVDGRHGVVDCAAGHCRFYRLRKTP